MFTYMTTKNYCCNSTAIIHCALCILSYNTEVCTSKPVAEILWVNRDRFISASFLQTCSNRCWTFISKGMQNYRRITSWFSASYAWKSNMPTQTSRTRRYYQIKLDKDVKKTLDKDVRKTFAGSVPSLFRDLPKCTADANEKRRLFKLAVIS